jgi:hypothetical protein
VRAKTKKEIRMNVNYEQVKTTSFGKFLGCALTTDPALLVEADHSNLSVSLTVNDKVIDFQRLFTAFDRSPDGTTTQTTSQNERVRELYYLLTRALNDCEEVNSNVQSGFSDGVGSASSSYYAGEYASEAAYEAGMEHCPGDECTSEIWSKLSEARTMLRAMFPDMDF